MACDRAPITIARMAATEDMNAHLVAAAMIDDDMRNPCRVGISIVPRADEVVDIGGSCGRETSSHKRGRRERDGAPKNSRHGCSPSDTSTVTQDDRRSELHEP